MCLAVPMRIQKIEDETAIVEASGIKQKIGLQLLPNVKVGDYVIVHAGFAIQIMDEVSAKEALQLFEEMGRLS
ncbi:HypC/HybG/HupF family hydrogenase formation chaperone [bacterium]